MHDDLPQGLSNMSGNANDSRPIVRSRLYLIYFALAAFDLVAISLSLYLIDRITNIYAESVEVNQIWAQRVEDYVSLMRMAAAVNAPGNDVFDSGNVEGESRRLRDSMAAFTARAKELRAELTRNVGRIEAATLLGQFDSMDSSMDRMYQQAQAILEHFRHGRLTEAGEAMAAMDRQYMQVIEEISQQGAQVRQLQREYSLSQVAAAASWRKLEYVIAGLILAMVVGVTIYGHTLAQQMKRAAEEITRHREHLAEMVRERTAQLEHSHAQLRQADRLASIGTLAAGLGHDMNNVLLPVRARLDTLQAINLPVECSEQFEAIRQSIGYLQQLSDGLHMLSLDPEELEASDRTTHVQTWWKQVGPLLANALPERIAFAADVADDLPAISVAPHRLTQAVLNLVVNAGEAIVGEGSVRLTAENLPDAGAVRISVQDTGHGMTPEVLEHALDPFFTTKKRGLGTGLGLSLVRAAVKSAGGTIQIDSKQERGTTVSLIFRRADHIVADRPHALPARTAAISVADRRAATAISAILQASLIDVQYVHGRDPGPSQLWVLDSADLDSRSARKYLQEDKRRQMIAIGPMSEQWDVPGVLNIHDPADFELIRQTIARAITSMDDLDTE